MTGAVPEDVKACCSLVYSNEGVRMLLGDSWHPGGIGLTDRLAAILRVGPGSLVLDLAAGRGTSAIHLAERYGCSVVGIDLSACNVESATDAAAAAGVSSLVEFQMGDAECTQVDAGRFDAVICECALCTFPDKDAAAIGIARALRPGGRVGISDITRCGDLPTELDSLVAHVACVGAALPVEQYRAILERAGLGVDHVESHDRALADMARDIRTKLLSLRILERMVSTLVPGLDLSAAEAAADAAMMAISDGRLGYAIVCAAKPTDPRPE